MSKPRVLLAEDDAGVASALRRLLQGDVDLLDVVHDGNALLFAARMLKPDVIVTDLFMPGMNGIEVTRQLRLDGSTARIILLTADWESQTAAEVQRLGASALLTKVDAGESLLDTIQQVVGADDRRELQ